MRRVLWSLAGATCACSAGEKAPQPGQAAADSAAHAAVDTVKPLPALDSAARRKKAAIDDRLRDSSFGPKFEVDSSGRLRPIKKP